MEADQADAVVLVVQHQGVQLTLGEVGVSEESALVVSGDMGEVAQVRGEVHDPGAGVQHRHEGLADVLHAPVVGGQRPLHLPRVQHRILTQAEVHPRVVDQDVDLAMLLMHHVPELHDAVDFSDLQSVEVDHVRLLLHLGLDELVQLLCFPSRRQINVG